MPESGSPETIAGGARRALAAALQPTSIGALRLPHRIAMGAMHLGFEADPGAGARVAAFYRERALAGAGLICTGGWAVSPDGAADRGYGIVAGEGLAALEEVAAATAGTEAKLALQLFHAGRYAGPDCPGEVVAPSPLASRVSRVEPRELGEDEVWSVVEDFAAAAARARELGFAAVEVMGSEGYLVDQFLSPETNRREDSWGGDVERRMRFGVELAAAVRAAVGEGFPVLFRMTGAELMPRSRPAEEVAAFAAALAGAGVDALNVGVGWHESPVPTVQGPVPPGVWLPWAEAVKAAVGEGAAVIAGNRVNRVEQAAALLERGGVDLISMSRPFLADAELVARARAGRRVNVCIACDQACIDRSMRAGRVSCLVNPRAGHEAALEPLRAPAGSRFAVVGGGPAGLEAARALAEMGGEVELLEAGPELGGQFRLARLVPGKEDYGETIAYFEAELERLGVRVRLGRAVGEADAGMLAGVDGVVLASGVVPRRVGLPGASALGEERRAEAAGAGARGAELPAVVDYPAAFGGAVAGARSVAIVGAGGIGVDLAHWLTAGGDDTSAADFLAEHDLEPPVAGYGRIARTTRHAPGAGAPAVTLMRRGGRIGEGIGPTTRWVWLAALRRAGVRTMTGVEYRAIVPGGIEVVAEGGEPELVEADAVVVAAGQERNDGLRPLLERAGVPFRVVGGAHDAAELNAVRAFADGLAAARELVRGQ